MHDQASECETQSVQEPADPFYAASARFQSEYQDPDALPAGLARLESLSTVKLLLILAALSFVLRVFYTGHLYQDDGLWFTAGEQLTAGKALYREIYFDKPPLLPLLYALVFKVFGAHIIAIRLFTIVYATAISGVLYVFGSRVYDRRTGILTAVLFTFFSTTFVSGHVQGLNTDFLMLLPYAAGAYLFVCACNLPPGLKGGPGRRLWLALGGGFLSGLAFQTNPKGIFNLAFFAILLIVTRRWYSRGSAHAAMGRDANPTGHGERPAPAPVMFLCGLAGFTIACLLFIGYLAQTRALIAYWDSVWVWGSRYAGYYPLSRVLSQGLRVSVGYFALNNTLLIGLIWLTATTVKRMKQAALRRSEMRGGLEGVTLLSDMTLLIWLGASFVGLATGGRFYAHYFFEVLPALCLIGARGLARLAAALKHVRRDAARRVAVAMLAAGFAVTVVRFHTRTATLAAGWALGRQHEMNAGWLHEDLNHEERMAAAVVTELPAGPESVDRLGPEAIRQASRPLREDSGSAAYLFVWGYRPEIYYWSGLLPASRYLSTQPLTGVPGDVQYQNGENRSILGEGVTEAARARLLADLSRTQPKYIIDELGMFNSKLGIKDFPELREFMRNYKPVGETGRFMVYRKRTKRKRAPAASGQESVSGTTPGPSPQ